MVIVERDGAGYQLRGSRKNDRATVPYWPTGSDMLIKAGANVKADPEWLAECGRYGRQLLCDAA